MSPFKIYRKTMIFSWMKLGISMLTLFVSLAIIFVAYIIIKNMAFELFTSIIIGCVAFLVAVALYYIVMGRLGYSIKMGHLAIVERAQRGEDIPSNPIEFSKSVVTSRFGSNRQFYGYSRNIKLTIRQLIRVILKGFSLESSSPNLKSTQWLTHLIATPSLRCSDECCLAFALRRSDYEVNAAVVDALTLLVQEWKQFSSKALKIGLIHILICLLTFAFLFVPGFFIFRDLGLNVLLWLGIAFFLTLTVKVAFYDSYVLTKSVCEFLAIISDAKIESKNYVKLDSWSKYYAKLRNSAEKAAEKAEDEADRAERAAKKAVKTENAGKKALPKETESETANSYSPHEPIETEESITADSELTKES